MEVPDEAVAGDAKYLLINIFDEPGEDAFNGAEEEMEEGKELAGLLNPEEEGGNIIVLRRLINNKYCITPLTHTKYFVNFCI